MEPGMQPQRIHVADRYFMIPVSTELMPSTLAALRNFRSACSFLTQQDVPVRTRVTLVVRCARAFLFPRAHSELSSLDTYANYVVPTVGADLFHHINRRYYLAKNLSLHQRTEFMLTHYRFEDASFNAAYRRKVYRESGLVLWARKVRDAEFEIRLCLADRYAAEGELSVRLLVDGERLHTISFSWANAEFARPKKTIVPFITANQGRRTEERAQAKFDAAFPQNAPNFACYAAMQGIAEAIGAAEMLAVSGQLQVCFTPGDAKNFGNAYDIFWNAVGGVELPACGWALPVPRPLKPIEEVAAKHRRRTAAKRAFWEGITNSTAEAIAAHVRMP